MRRKEVNPVEVTLFRGKIFLKLSGEIVVGTALREFTRAFRELGFCKKRFPKKCKGGPERYNADCRAELPEHIELWLMQRVYVNPDSDRQAKQFYPVRFTICEKCGQGYVILGDLKDSDELRELRKFLENKEA